MQIYGPPTIPHPSQEKTTLSYYLTNSLGSLGSSSWEAKTNSLTHSNSGYQEQRWVEIDRIVHKRMVRESLSVLHFKVFAKREESKSDTPHEENGIVEQCWRTLAQMKDSFLIDSGLPTQFWAEAIDTANYLQN